VFIFKNVINCFVLYADYVKLCPFISFPQNESYRKFTSEKLAEREKKNRPE